MEVMRLSVSKKRLNNNRSAKLRSRNIDNSRRGPGKLRLSSSCCNRRLRSLGNISTSSRRNNILCSRGGGA
jgi:hypothetical protein